MDIVIDHNGDPAEIFLEYICAKAQLSHSEFPKISHDDIFEKFITTAPAPGLKEPRNSYFKDFFGQLIKRIEFERRMDISYGTSLGTNLTKIYTNMMIRFLRRAYSSRQLKKEE